MQQHVDPDSERVIVDFMKGMVVHEHFVQCLKELKCIHSVWVARCSPTPAGFLTIVVHAWGSPLCHPMIMISHEYTAQAPMPPLEEVVHTFTNTPRYNRFVYDMGLINGDRVIGIRRPCECQHVHRCIARYYSWHRGYWHVDRMDLFDTAFETVDIRLHELRSLLLSDPDVGFIGMRN